MAATKRLLIVDDEDDIREVAQLSLEMVGGWEVESASSGAMAIASAASMRPDAILLDVMMPEMDGPTTLHRLREMESTRAIPVIFLTAKVQSTDLNRLTGLGAAGVISKPFDPMELPGRIAKTLGWSG